MKKLLLAIILMTASLPANAQDAPYEVQVPVPGAGRATCYSHAEAEAEQGIRIHSELMVIALNCQHMTPAGWKNFYQQYREITNRNKPLLAAYETALIDFYGRAGRPNPERALHDLRTSMANKVSTDAARMRPDIFCSRFAPRLPKVEKMSAAEFKGWASNYQNGPRPSQPMCGR